MEGLKEALEALQTQAARTALRFASRKAAEVVRAAAEANAPVGSEMHKTYKGRLVAPGFLSRSLNTAVSYVQQKGAVIARIGPRREAFYGTQFVEIGTSKMPARPWLRPAYEGARADVERTFVTALRAAIARAVKRGKTR